MCHLLFCLTPPKRKEKERVPPPFYCFCRSKASLAFPAPLSAATGQANPAPAFGTSVLSSAALPAAAAAPSSPSLEAGLRAQLGAAATSETEEETEEEAEEEEATKGMPRSADQRRSTCAYFFRVLFFSLLLSQSESAET